METLEELQKPTTQVQQSMNTTTVKLLIRLQMLKVYEQNQETNLFFMQTFMQPF